MFIPELISDQALTWLIENKEPNIRYLALRDLLDKPASDGELAHARALAHQTGPIPVILKKMEPEGYWVKACAGYYPKYTGSAWSIILLAQLGASIQEDERILRACNYLLVHALAPGGQFSTNGAPSGTIDCLQGNLCAAMLDMGMDDPRLQAAFEWIASSLTGEGVAPVNEKDARVRYYAYKCGPVFACGANNKLPCAWGGVKVMLALGKLPAERRTPMIQRAIQKGVEFFLGIDPATADYPTGWAEKPSQNWWKFGFPVFYVTDLLQLVEALQLCGHTHDPRLKNAHQVILDKRDSSDRWAMEYHYTGKMWVEFGSKRQPNPWVTLRALKVLKAGFAL
jgi:hypothetical protein